MKEMMVKRTPKSINFLLLKPLISFGWTLECIFAQKKNSEFVPRLKQCSCAMNDQ